jgi:hypothetical protein
MSEKTFAEKYKDYLKIQKQFKKIVDEQNITFERNFLYDKNKIVIEEYFSHKRTEGLRYNVDTKKISAVHKIVKENKDLYNEFKSKLISLGFEVKED